MRARQVAPHGNIGHGFQAAADDNIRPAGHHAQSGLRNGLQAGSAKAVDGGAGDINRKAGNLGSNSANIQPLLGFRKAASDHNVFHIIFFQVFSAFNGRAQNK